jgi:hypothetical protein
VVVDSSRCREVLRGGAVLGAWSNLSEGGQSGLPVVAGMAEEEERVLHGRGGRPLQPLEAVDDGGVAVGKRWTGKWWRRGRVCGQGGGHCLKEVGAVWAPSVRETDTRGPRGFDFSNLFKTGSNWKSKRMSYLNTKIPQFCMLLDWGILNNFLNCAEIQISIDVELKFLEQIHNLNFW